MAKKQKAKKAKKERHHGQGKVAKISTFCVNISKRERLARMGKSASFLIIKRNS